MCSEPYPWNRRKYQFISKCHHILSFSFLVHAASSLPLRCSEVKLGQAKTTTSACQSTHPISCLAPATLPSQCPLLLGNAHLHLWRVFLPDKLQAWSIQWTQFLSISSCHFWSNQGSGHQRSRTGRPSKANGWSFSYSIISTPPEEVTQGNSDA